MRYNREFEPIVHVFCKVYHKVVCAKTFCQVKCPFLNIAAFLKVQND